MNREKRESRQSYLVGCERSERSRQIYFVECERRKQTELFSGISYRPWYQVQVLHSVTVSDQILQYEIASLVFVCVCVCVCFI